MYHFVLNVIIEHYSFCYLCAFVIVIIISLLRLFVQLFGNYTLQRKPQTSALSQNNEIENTVYFSFWLFSINCGNNFVRCLLYVFYNTRADFVWFSDNGNLWGEGGGQAAKHVKPHYSFPIFPSLTHTSTNTFIVGLSSLLLFISRRNAQMSRTHINKYKRCNYISDIHKDIFSMDNKLQ